MSLVNHAIFPEIKINLIRSVRITMIIVTFLLLATISATWAGDLVEVWGIARCPDTSKFVHNQLVPFYKNNTPFPAEFKLDFHAVPTGGSMVDGKYM